MGERVLVIYGSKYGATKEIAEGIRKALAEAGLEADIKSADDAGDPAGYTAVVLGSGVYYGRWRKSASRFLKNNEAALAGLPLWIFSSGPTGEGDPDKLTEGWRYPKSLQPLVERLKPRDIAVFGGMIDTEKLNPLERMAIKKVEAPSGDFRDWDAVSAWARDIAGAIKER